jgi:hypothetical protein
MMFDPSTPYDLSVGMLVFLFFVVLGRILINASHVNRETLMFQARLFTIAIGIRFALSLALYSAGLVSVLGDLDSSGWTYGDALRFFWDKNGYGIVDLPYAWKGAFAGNHLGHYYLLGTMFFLLGVSSRLAAAALNCFAGALTVVFAYRAARTLFSQKVAEQVGWWTCLFPSMIIWSAQTVKEPVVILLEMVALYGCLQLKRSGFALRYVLITGVSIVMMVPFRFYAAYIAAAAVGLSLLVPHVRKGKMSIGPALALAAVIIPLVIGTGALATNETAVEQFDLEFVQKFRQDIAAGSGSAMVVPVDMRTRTGFGIGVAVGAAHLLLAPFPWQLGGGSLRMLLTTPELVYWWWLFFVGVVPGFRYVAKHRLGEILPIVVFLFGLGLLYSMMFGNVGLIFRQRAQILPWLFMFGAVGLELRAAKKLQAATRAPAVSRLLSAPSGHVRG